LQRSAALAPELAMHLHKPSEEHEGQDKDQQPSDNGYRMMMRTMFQVIELRQFIEGVIFHSSTVMANAPNRFLGVAVQFLRREPTPMALFGHAHP